jgi:hypothetical protein
MFFCVTNHDSDSTALALAALEDATQIRTIYICVALIKVAKAIIVVLLSHIFRQKMSPM